MLLSVILINNAFQASDPRQFPLNDPQVRRLIDHTRLCVVRRDTSDFYLQSVHLLRPSLRDAGS